VLKQVVYNSIHYAFIDPAEKKLQLQQLDRRFIQFEAAAAKLADGSPRPLH
jgi:predicted metalloprotease